MKKKLLTGQILYYVAMGLVYYCALAMTSWIFDTTNPWDDLGLAIAVVYGVIFVLTPIFVVAFMRLSLLPCIVDPIAAAEIPLFLYVGMVMSQVKRADSFAVGIEKLHRSLSADSGQGWLFLLGLFLLGLAASISPARKRGENLTYRLLFRKEKE